LDLFADRTKPGAFEADAVFAGGQVEQERRIALQNAVHRDRSPVGLALECADQVERSRAASDGELGAGRLACAGLALLAARPRGCSVVGAVRGFRVVGAWLAGGGERRPIRLWIGASLFPQIQPGIDESQLISGGARPRRRPLLGNDLLRRFSRQPPAE